jgi:hypothetical protein
MADPTMHHCLFVNDTIYYSLMSLNLYNHASQKFKFVERKLPPLIGRYFLLFRSIVQKFTHLFSQDETNLIFPSRNGRSKVSVRQIIQDLFVLETPPGMTQIRHFWAGVSNFVTGPGKPLSFLTSNEIGALQIHLAFTCKIHQSFSLFKYYVSSHFSLFPVVAFTPCLNLF